jgi:hypothetical protein
MFVNDTPVSSLTVVHAAALFLCQLEGHGVHQRRCNIPPRVFSPNEKAQA